MQVIGDIVRLNAKRYPDKKALIMGNDFLTYSQLNRQANQLAHGLLSLGVNPGDRVAVLAFNCIESVTLQYAIAKCGGIAVPINFRYKKNELISSAGRLEPHVASDRYHLLRDHRAGPLLQQSQLSDAGWTL